MHTENRYTSSLREASKKICVKANPQPSAETVPYSASNDLKSTSRRHEAKEKMRSEECCCVVVGWFFFFFFFLVIRRPIVSVEFVGVMDDDDMSVCVLISVCG